jgi:hypothetical protein
MAEWVNPDNKEELVKYTNRRKMNKGTGAGVYRWGSKRGHSFSLGLHTTILQVEI